MNKYYIEFLNKQGKDREAVLSALTPQDALNQLYNNYEVDCYLDIVDITSPNEDEHFNVLDCVA
jgi:hypothetical protein